jgi:hypothetical protein
MTLKLGQALGTRLVPIHNYDFLLEVALVNLLESGFSFIEIFLFWQGIYF